MTRRPLSPGFIASVLIHHLVPVIWVLWFDQSAAQFLLLSLCNCVFAIMGSITANLAVSQLQAPPRPGVTGWFRIEPWVSLALVSLVFTGLMIGLFGMILFSMLPNAAAALADHQLWSALAMMVLSMIAGLVLTARADLQSGQPEPVRKARDQPRILLNVLSGFVLLLLSSYASEWFGNWALPALMVALTGFFILRDLRPDLIKRAFFPANRSSA